MIQAVVDYYNEKQNKYVLKLKHSYPYPDGNGTVYIFQIRDKYGYGSIRFYEWFFNSRFEVFEIFLPHKVYGGVLEDLSKGDFAWQPEALIEYLHKQIGRKE